MKIGDKIAKARKLQNLTQDQLADCLDVTRQAVSRWESDLAYPEMEKIVKLSEILHINCDYLLKDNVTESGEKVLKVEAAKKEVSLYKKLNWRYIDSICGVICGLYILSFCSIFAIFNRSSFSPSNGWMIAFTVLGILIAVAVLAISCIFIGKCISKKEYFIKNEYK